MSVTSEAHSESSQTYMMDVFVKIVYVWKPLTAFAKNCNLVVKLCYEYNSGPTTTHKISETNSSFYVK